MTGKPRLVIGQAEALEGALARDVAGAQRADPLAPVAVLVGGTLLRPHLGRRLAELNGGIANVRLLMPSELALIVGERAQLEAGRKPLPPLADRILLREIAREHGGYFEPVGRMPGFADALHRLVRELRGAGYESESFARAVAGACEPAGKDDALAALFADFLGRRSDFYGPDDCLLSADAGRLDAEALAVYGLWELPAALRRCVERLAARIPVTVYLPTAGPAADDAHATTRAWLEALGAEREELPEEPVDGSGLDHLKRGLFRAGGPAPLDGSVRLLSGPDPAREAREVARTCLEWAREGIGFHEMALVYRDADDYRPALEAVFREAGIPLYVHEGTPLIERPIGRRVTALLDLNESNLERRAVMDFLTDAALPERTRADYGDAPAARWDKLSRDAGIVEGASQWGDRLAAWRRRLHGDVDLDQLDEPVRGRIENLDHLDRFVADLATALRDHPARGPWSAQLGALRRLLERYVDDPRPVLEALAPLERFDALSAEVEFDRFREVVRGALENLRASDVLDARAGAFASRGVNLLDATSVRHLRFRAVAVLGLAERRFPPPPTQDPLLLDHERERLNARGPAPVPLRVRGADPEPLQFALAASAATDRLLLTYPRKSAGDSRPQLPSAFFRAAAAAMTGDSVTTAEVDALPADLYTRAEGNRIGAAKAELALSPAERDRTLVEEDRALGRAVLADTELRVGRGLAARRARFEAELTPFDGALSPAAREHLTALLDPERPFAATRLETYATCPQQYFLGNVLHAQPIEEPESTTRISPMRRGSLIHAVLERFLNDPPPGEELLFGPGEEDRLLALTQEECRRAEQRGETGYPLMWSYDRREIEDDMRAWLAAERDDPSFRALPNGDFEARFGGRRYEEREGRLSRDEPLEISAHGVQLRVGGRIDRLNWDEDETRYRVVDYKTGRAGRDHVDDSLRGGRALQLPLYLLAGADLLGIDPERGSAEYHFVTRRGRLDSRKFSGSALAERRGDLDSLLAGIAEGIRSGTFQMAPPEERTCRWCDFDGLCPTARWAQIRRKQDDERALRLTKLREID